MLDMRSMSIAAGVMILLNLNCYSAGSPTRFEVMASIVGAKGTVQVDRQTARPQEVIFAGDVVSTGASSAVILNLRNGNLVTLSENSEMSFLGPKDSATVTLMNGALVASSGNSQSIRVNVPGAQVIVGGGGAFFSTCRIASISEAAVVITVKGHVEVRCRGIPVVVLPGKTVQLLAGVPQGGG